MNDTKQTIEDCRSDELFITIINNKQLLEKVHKGLFVCASRSLGYNPKASSYPFVTDWYSAQTGYDPKFNISITALFIREAINAAIEPHTDNREQLANLHFCDHDSLIERLKSYYWDDMLIFAKHHKHYLTSWATVVHAHKQREES